MAKMVLEPHVEAILRDRYYLPGENWEKLNKRLVNALFPLKEDSEIRREVYDMFIQRDAILATPSLINAGARLGMLSSCFEYPIADSMECIFDTVKMSAMTFKKGGGVGIDYSTLRPAGDAIKSTQGISTGPLSFMENLNAAGMSVQGGGIRRAAQMGTLRTEHPDIMSFIWSKTNAQKKGDHEKFSNLNFSVPISDVFFDIMKFEETADENQWVTCLKEPNSKEIVPNRWIIISENEGVRLRALHGDKVVRQVKDGLWCTHWNGEIYDIYKAKDVFDAIAEAAWEVGDPGLIFIDRVNKYNYVNNMGVIRNSNPCGEHFGMSYATCNLGAINLNNHLKKRDGDWDYTVDWEKLENTTRLMTITLDRVVTINKLPNNQSEVVTLASRPLGLGYFGLANVLIHLKLKYDSHAGRNFAGELTERITYWSMDQSTELAKLQRDKPMHDFGVMKKYGTSKLFYDNTGSDPFLYNDKLETVNIQAESVGTKDANFPSLPAVGRLVPWEDSGQDEKYSGSFPAFIGSKWDLSGIEFEEKFEGGTNIQQTRTHYEKLFRGHNDFLADMCLHGNLPLEQWLLLINKIRENGIRNAHTTFLMPTGTTSYICNSINSSGCEPLTSVEPFERKHAETTEKGETVYVTRTYMPNVVEKYAESVLGIDVEKIHDGTVKIDKNILPEYFQASHDISVEGHVLMQANLQRFIHNGISKTINMPHDATIKDITKAYLDAYNAGCKGLTVYRDGSKYTQIINTKKTTEAAREIPKEPPRVALTTQDNARVFRFRDPELPENERDEVYLITTLLDNYPIELFVKFGTEISGHASSFKLRNLAMRLASLLLRHGYPLDKLIKQFDKTSSGMDFSYQISRILKQLLSERYSNSEKDDIPKNVYDIIRPPCPTQGCNGRLVYEEKCMKCPSCGFSACG
ncbi:MAG: adenosylcobalamin-dependent ribonucleoside-diphosphate reductase [Candidatus Omnitrophica bacterium]|nr:adenosylcobalamin-dependent ribonucleoside-diphosphate reductase [Candidatus Omnitrophota bacterium]